MAISLKATVNALAPSAAHASGGATATTIAADLTAVSDAITAAAADATISADPTAAGLVQAAADAFDTLNSAVGAIDLTTVVAGDVVLTFNPATVLTKNMLRSCVASILRGVDGSADLT